MGVMLPWCCCGDDPLRLSSARRSERSWVMVRHEPASNPPMENERFVDALFAALLLMCLAGGRVNVEPVGVDSPSKVRSGVPKMFSSRVYFFEIFGPM